MHAERPISGMRAALSAAAAVALILFPLSAGGAGIDTTVSLELWPHCDAQEFGESFAGPTPDTPYMTKLVEESCRPFETKDPLTRQTPVMRPGDVLDMDLMLRNAPEEEVTRVRGWLAYDPDVLEGDSIEFEPGFSAPTPGESEFSPSEGYAKIGAAAPDAVDGTFVRVARIKMRIKEGADNDTVISFYDPQEGTDGHSVVVIGEPSDEDGVMELPLGALLVRLPGGPGGPAQPDPPSQAASSASAGDPAAGSAFSLPSFDPNAGGAASSAPAQEASSASSAAASQAAPAQTGPFTLLQIQNLRATTDDSTVYLAWDALQSMDLAGYNVYYGTVSGQYIQRRSVDRFSTTLAIRNLPVGTTYYFAVRGADAAGDETQFSREVGVTVGNPATSTNPLTAAAIDQGPQGQAPDTGGAVAGETGLSTSLIAFAVASAAIGTVLAFRRQLSAVPADAR